MATKWKEQHQFEDSHLTSLPENAWLVRPCEVYDDEYMDCKSIKGRFHQYFIFGATKDCQKWKEDFDNCMKWRNHKDVEALKIVIDNETERIETRKKAALENDVWEYRTEPPKGWNAPLPKELTKDHPGSYLETKRKEELGIILPKLEEKSSCIIS